MKADAEGGFSLVEVLIAVVIMAILMVAILGGMGTSTAASGTHRRQTEAVALLVSSAERLKSQSEVPYVTCALTTDASYLSAVHASQMPGDPILSGDDISITDVSYWQGDGTFTPNVADCHDNIPILRLQLITLTITSGSVSEMLQVVKRDTP